MHVTPVPTMTLEQYHAKAREQQVPTVHIAVVCPICQTIQSGADLIAAGAGADFDAVERYLGFSCVGRFTGRKGHEHGTPPGKGCDWTLGGLFRLHRLEVITPDGERHPRFELTTPEQAQAHASAKA